MARNLTSADLRRLADELDRDDERVTIEALRAEVEELKGRKPSREEIVSVLAELDDDERAELGLPVRETEEIEEEAEPKRKRKGKLQAAPEPEQEQEAPKLRPGRKSGNAYAWDVDEQGQVVGLNHAKVYMGEDEPDEVEIPELREAEQEEGGETEAA